MGLDVVGLVSGGKDSVFAIHFAQQLGHRLCAVATLLPGGGVAESDSYMYQSVGTNIVSSIAECMKVPFFCRTIEGLPVHTDSLDYRTTPGDEVEDLFALLHHVKEEIPEIQAVSCGAILSEYQRRRVENVCLRLGLTPLCFMWNRSQQQLLREMVNWGLNALVIKTASMGLDHRHLGKSIADLERHFLHLKSAHGFHVCGEGGEYETLTVDCPLFIDSSIYVEEWKQIDHGLDPVAPVGILVPLKWHLQRKQSESCSPNSNPRGKFLSIFELVRSGASIFAAYRGMMERAITFIGDIPIVPLSVTLLESDGRMCRSRTGSYLNLPCDFPAGSHAKTPTLYAGSEHGHHDTHSVNVDLTCDSQIIFSERKAGCKLVCDECVTLWFRTCDVRLVESYPTEADNIDLKEQCLKMALYWLQQQFITDWPSHCKDSDCARRIRPIDILCQVQDYEMISGFWWRDFPYQHLLTVVKTPLPRSTFLRIRAMFTLSADSLSKVDSCLLPIIWLPPAEGDVLHVHSLNMWVAPCTALTHGRSPQSCTSGECFSCQSLSCRRMEKHGDATDVVSGICVCGFDGRLPHTGNRPDPEKMDFLRCFSGTKQCGAASLHILSSLVFQTCAAFWSIQNAMRLSSSNTRTIEDGSFRLDDCGLSEALDFEREYILGEDRADIAIENTLAPSKKPFPPPPMFVLFVACPSLSSCQDTWSRIMIALTKLIQDMSLKALKLSQGSNNVGERVDISSLVVTARVDDLPADSVILLKPLGPQYDTANRQICSFRLDDFSGTYIAPSSLISWSVLVDVCNQYWPRNISCEARPLEEATVSIVRISFQQRNHASHVSDYTSSFRAAFESATEFTIRRYIHPSHCGIDGVDSRGPFLEVVKTCFEVYVFYTVQHAEQFGNDSSTFEKLCEVGLSEVCRRILGPISRLPALTCVPAVQLSESEVQVVFSTF